MLLELLARMRSADGWKVLELISVSGSSYFDFLDCLVFARWDSNSSAGLNYKSKTFDEDLKAATKDGVDVFFDNVAGEILDKAILTMNRHGRIAQCGAVSSYNSGNSFTSKNYFLVITMRLQIKGFIVLDWLEHAGEALDIFKKALQEGKLKIGDDNETVVDTKFEDVPKTWTMLFDGGNTGKLVTKLV